MRTSAAKLYSVLRAKAPARPANLSVSAINNRSAERVHSCHGRTGVQRPDRVALDIHPHEGTTVRLPRRTTGGAVVNARTTCLQPRLWSPPTAYFGNLGGGQMGLVWWQNIDMQTDAGVRIWLRRIRGVVLMGLAWAAAWGPVGVLAGLVVDSDGSMDEMWVAVGAYPGFLCGAVFSVVIGATKGDCRLDKISLSRVGIRGAVSGLVVGAFPFALLASNDADGFRGWPLGVVLIASFTLLSAASAAGSVKVAKWRARKERSTPRRI